MITNEFLLSYLLLEIVIELIGGLSMVAIGIIIIMIAERKEKNEHNRSIRR